MNLLSRTARTLFIGLSFAGVCACNGAPKHTASIRPSYDKATGQLKELAYDANGNGRMASGRDSIAHKPGPPGNDPPAEFCRPLSTGQGLN